MTEKEKLISKSFKSFKIDYPFFYNMIIFIGILVIFAPFFIWISYRIGDSYIIIPTNTSEGELLALWGAILSCFSTFALGGLALWQNVKANQINNRLSLIEKERFKLDLQPFIVITAWQTLKVNLEKIEQNPPLLCYQIDDIPKDEKECAFLILDVINTSNTYTMVSYITSSIYKNDKLIRSVQKNSTSNIFNETLYLESGQKGKIGFYFSLKKVAELNNKKLKVEFSLRNRFNDAYLETVDIVISAMVSIKGEEDFYTMLNPQEYKINKKT